MAALRRGDPSTLTAVVSDKPLWLSAVVLEELYAGSRPKDRHALELLEQSSIEADRLLVPNLDDWKQTGLVLADIAGRFGYEEIRGGRLTNDALIGTGAARKGLVVLTTNRRDFARLAEFLPFRWRVVDLH